MAKRAPYNKGKKCIRKKRVPGVGMRCASFGAKKRRKKRVSPYAKTQYAKTKAMWRRTADAKTQVMLGGARKRRRR